MKQKTRIQPTTVSYSCLLTKLSTTPKDIQISALQCPVLHVKFSGILPPEFLEVKKQKKKVLTNKHQHQQTMCLNKCLMTHDLTYMTQLDELWPCLSLHLRVRYNSGHYSARKQMHPKKLRPERSSPCYHAGQWWLGCSQVRYWKRPATDTDAFPHVAKVPTRDLLLSFIPHPDITKNYLDLRLEAKTPEEITGTARSLGTYELPVD